MFATSPRRIASVFMFTVLLPGCAQPAQPAASARSTRSAEPSRPAPVEVLPPPAVDSSTASAFTQSLLLVFQYRDPQGSWRASEALTLANKTGLLVSLERIWHACSVNAGGCGAIVEHFTNEAMKIASRSSEPKADRSQLVPVVRPGAYFDAVSESVRAAALSEPFVADLIVIYVADQGGAVRGANADDLSGNGIARDELPAVARENLAAALPSLTAASVCESHSITLLSTGNFFESSRLLLPDLWSEIARSHRSVIAAAPSADSLVIACDPSQPELDKLSAVVTKLWQDAERPMSHSLLEWTKAGWRELRR